MQQNAVSKGARTRLFLKYMCLGSSEVTYWDWKFIDNLSLLKS